MDNIQIIRMPRGHLPPDIMEYKMHRTIYIVDSPDGSDGNESACNAGDLGLIPGQEDPREKKMATHSSILAWRIHGQRTLAGYSPWGRKESDCVVLLFFKIGSTDPYSHCPHNDRLNEG